MIFITRSSTLSCLRTAVSEGQLRNCKSNAHTLLKPNCMRNGFLEAFAQASPYVTMVHGLSKDLAILKAMRGGTVHVCTCQKMPTRYCDLTSSLKRAHYTHDQSRRCISLTKRAHPYTNTDNKLNCHSIGLQISTPTPSTPHQGSFSSAPFPSRSMGNAQLAPQRTNSTAP